MKGYIKRLLREGLLSEDNFGYRAGDITSRKPEQRNKFSTSGRHTGHFGTGYYFFGTIEKAEKYAESEKRVITKIPLDGYNLAKGTLELHEILKLINDYDVLRVRNDEYNEKLKYSLSILLDYFGLDKNKYCDEVKNFKEKYPIKNNRDYYNVTDDYIEKSNQEMRHLLMLRTKCNKVTEELINKIIKILDDNKTHEDSSSTLVMKTLGYDGVDSRYTELDNGVYGSVLYDVEKVERESARMFIDKRSEELNGGVDDKY